MNKQELKIKTVKATTRLVMELLTECEYLLDFYEFDVNGKILQSSDIGLYMIGAIFFGESAKDLSDEELEARLCTVTGKPEEVIGNDSIDDAMKLAFLMKLLND